MSEVSKNVPGLPSTRTFALSVLVVSRGKLEVSASVRSTVRLAALDLTVVEYRWHVRLNDEKVGCQIFGPRARVRGGEQELGGTYSGEGLLSVNRAREDQPTAPRNFTTSGPEDVRWSCMI